MYIRWQRTRGGRSRQRKTLSGTSESHSKRPIITFVTRTRIAYNTYNQRHRALVRRAAGGRPYDRLSSRLQSIATLTSVGRTV